MRIPLRTAVLLIACATLAARIPSSAPAAGDPKVELGAFSVGHSVKDIKASRAFYESLGFGVVLGKQEQNWLILRNGTTTIGLFQGMFEGNLLTFNPGWDAQAKPLESFEDVRELQKKLETAGLKLVTRADPESSGPASLSLRDPDGNMILVDQHVP